MTSSDQASTASSVEQTYITEALRTLAGSNLPDIPPKERRQHSGRAGYERLHESLQRDRSSALDAGFVAQFAQLGLADLRRVRSLVEREITAREESERVAKEPQPKKAPHRPPADPVKLAMAKGFYVLLTSTFQLNKGEAERIVCLIVDTSVRQAQRYIHDK